jgi:hypothetical protein
MRWACRFMHTPGSEFAGVAQVTGESFLPAKPGMVNGRILRITAFVKVIVYPMRRWNLFGPKEARAGEQTGLGVKAKLNTSRFATETPSTASAVRGSRRPLTPSARDRRFE